VVRVPLQGDWARLNRYLLRLQRLPHVVIVDGDKIAGVIPADRVLRVDRSKPVEDALQRLAHRKFHRGGRQ